MKKTMFTTPPPVRAQKQSNSLLIIALAAIISFTFLACPDDSGSDGKKSDGSITVGDYKWSAYTDKGDGGTSTVTMTAAGGKVTLKGNVVKIEGETYGYAAAEVTPNPAALAALKNADYIYFKTSGDGNEYVIEVRTSDVTDYDYFQTTFYAEDRDTVINLDGLLQGGWGEPIASFDKSKITSIAFQARAEINEGEFEFTIWDIKAFTSEEMAKTVLLRLILDRDVYEISGELLIAAGLVDIEATGDEIAAYIAALDSAYVEAVLNSGNNWDILLAAVLDDEANIEDLFNGFVESFTLTNLNTLTNEAEKWKGYLSAYDDLLAAIDEEEATVDMFTDAGFTKLGPIADFDAFLEALADAIVDDMYYWDFYMAAYAVNNAVVE